MGVDIAIKATPVRDSDVTVTEHAQDIAVGCILAIAGNLLISVSLNIQKYTHMRNDKSESQKHYLRKPLWWIGFVLMVFGEIGNFSAYGFAPASLVAPLGTTTVIANMFIAVGLLKERLRPADIFGCSIAVVGAFLLVNFSTKTEKILDADDIIGHLQKLTFIIYVCTEVAVLIALFIVKLKLHVDSVLVLILITALLASFTVISAKAVSGMLQLTMAGSVQVNSAVFWVLLVIMVVTGIAQVKFLNQAMQLFDSTTVVPTNFVFFTISAILSGIIFYNEFWGMAPFDVFMFLLGCVMCFCGVYFITVGRVAESASTVQVSTVQSPPSTANGFTDVIPSWLLSPISQQHVQPRCSDLRHDILASTEQQPFISWDDDSGTIQEVSTPETLKDQQSPHSETKSPFKSPSGDVTAKYGSTGTP